MAAIGSGGHLEEEMSTPVDIEEWQRHNDYERRFWGDCRNTLGEQLKQEIYAKYMGLYRQYPSRWRWNFDLKGKSVVDIGGGPVSLLLRCSNFSKAVVVDPCPFPQWVLERYRLGMVEFVQQRAEEYEPPQRFDEAWIYNVLQHVQDPEKVVRVARSAARKLRVFEFIETPIKEGHPHSFTKEDLDAMFGQEGLAETFDDTQWNFDWDQIYFGVFWYD